MKPKPATRQAVPAPTVTDLQPIQAMLADLSGDIIGRGADEPTARQFVGAILRHSWKLRLPHCSDLDIQRYAASELEDTFRKLVRSWPDQTGVADAAAARDGATALVRSTMRARLVEALNEFVTRSTPEEGWMLLDMLEVWQSHASTHEAITNGLAEEMSIALGRADGQYVRVSARHEKVVQAFVDQLHKADDEAERRAFRHRATAA